MEKIRLGIIGCGYWGPNFVRNFKQINGVSVKYACDLSPGRLSHIKKLYPDIITTNDYLCVLRDKDIAGVIVATPASRHYRLAKESLLYRKNILVEKPIAMNIDEARELIKLAADKKRVLMVGHTFEFNPSVIKLRELIKSGSLGRVYYIYSRRTNLGPLRKDANAVWDLAPHDISIVNFILDKNPLSVSAQGAKYLPHNLEDVAFISLNYPNDILVHIHVSWLDPKKTREIVVVGSKKMAVFDDLNSQAPISVYDKSVMKKRFKQDYDSFEEFQMIIKNGKVQTPQVRKEEPLNVECRHFIECIRKNKAPLTGGMDGLEVLKVLVGIHHSLSDNGKNYPII
ncbi:MAG: Gfo/Idh/MocA family oxidoreductase [Candidatus Omnitrophota bacterium]